MAARGDYAKAAQFIESAPSSPDDSARLMFLKQMYALGADRNNYQRTVELLAKSQPKDIDAQIEYADLMYQRDDLAGANAVIVKLMKLRPNDVGLAGKILATWLARGPDALYLPTIQSQAAGASLEMKAAYAQFADEADHPELVQLIVGRNLSGVPITVENADALAALDYAIGLEGHRIDAIARLSEIIEFDSSHPRALLNRARLRAENKDFSGAIEDARRAVAQDPKNATARLALVDILAASGDRPLSESTLREAVRAMPDNVQLTARLAQLLISHGDHGLAAEALRNLARAAPVNLRAARLQEQLDPGAANDGDITH